MHLSSRRARSRPANRPRKWSSQSTADGAEDGREPEGRSGEHCVKGTQTTLAELSEVLGGDFALAIVPARPMRRFRGPSPFDVESFEMRLPFREGPQP